MNKFDLLNVVTVSDLGASDKALLTELILRADENGYSWPSVERLCMARGIKYEKNFKGADYYLPGLVTKAKRGRRMTYTINDEAIMALGKSEVLLKHTPAQAGVSSDTPAQEGVLSKEEEERQIMEWVKEWKPSERKSLLPA